MAIIKSFTDLSQSKVLAEFLPIESADMVIWGKDLDSIAVTDAQKFMSGLKNRKMNYLPCWSLAALLSVLPDYTLQTNTDGTVFVVCDSKKPMISDAYNNPVDACVEIIERLHELKML